jgi:hypothetical protein
MGVFGKEWGRGARMRHYSPTPDGGKNQAYLALSAATRLAKLATRRA